MAVFTAKLICATDKFHAFITIYADCADTAQTDSRVSTTHSPILSRLLLPLLANLMSSSLKPFIWASCSMFCWSHRRMSWGGAGALQQRNQTALCHVIIGGG